MRSLLLLADRDELKVAAVREEPWQHRETAELSPC
jgi:hypothetical protein